ncbi:hypothetical protein AVEN_164896-1 [Araneus ventricosus]|uniref:Uncharacterized protein n=1 Tax=Araneus ventricosus TaxID=182803 RepID=A0A4Y2DSY1_ARAVE|nr:hypothetical protein AVEN_164896-1 [Araneus ventricosus]
MPGLLSNWESNSLISDSDSQILVPDYCINDMRSYACHVTVTTLQQKRFPTCGTRIPGDTRNQTWGGMETNGGTRKHKGLQVGILARVANFVAKSPKWSPRLAYQGSNFTVCNTMLYLQNRTPLHSPATITFWLFKQCSGHEVEETSEDAPKLSRK